MGPFLHIAGGWGCSLRIAEQILRKSIIASERRSTSREDAGRFTRAIRNYPVTASVAMPYALLILSSAILNENPSLGFIVGVFLIAFLTALLFETFLAFVEARTPTRTFKQKDFSEHRKFLRNLGVFLMFFGLAASLITASMGVGTIDSAVGVSTASTSAIATILSLLSGWDVVGTGLVVWARSNDAMKSRSFYLIVIVALGLKLLHVIMLGITVQLWRYLICVFFLLMYYRLIRFRTIIAVMLVVLVIWPVFFEVRNQIRSDRGIAVSAQVDAADRLRYDLQIARADGIPPGLDLGQLDDPLEILRFGLIPRVLDSDRSEVSTGRLINQYLGGTATSAFTFLPVTTSYVLGNWYGTVMLYAWWSIFTFVLLRNGARSSPYRVVIFAFLLVGPLNWFSVHPDSAIGFLQDLVAASPVLLFIAFHTRQRTRLRSAYEDVS